MSEQIHTDVIGGSPRPVGIYKDRYHVLCPCGERIRIEANNCDAITNEGVEYLPKIIAVQCPRCGAEVRLPDKS